MAGWTRVTQVKVGDELSMGKVVKVASNKTHVFFDLEDGFKQQERIVNTARDGETMVIGAPLMSPREVTKTMLKGSPHYTTTLDDGATAQAWCVNVKRNLFTVIVRGTWAGVVLPEADAIEYLQKVAA